MKICTFKTVMPESDSNTSNLALKEDWMHGQQDMC